MRCAAAARRGTLDTLSVFQEQSMLLYIVVGLLVVLAVIGVGIWIRLGEVRDVLRGQRSQAQQTGSWRDRPKMSDIKVSKPAEGEGEQQEAPTMAERLADQPKREEAGVGDVASAYYGGKPPEALSGEPLTMSLEEAKRAGQPLTLEDFDRGYFVERTPQQ